MTRSVEISLESDDALTEWLHANRRTDGLPVVLPTADRVEHMLFVARLAGLDADIILGQVGPLMGEATVEKVAINAVMAGCLPEYFPVVIAAMRAVCDPRMDITEVQATTHDLTPLVLVNGPVIEAIGLAAETGALGYGHRANLTIGRAVRLCLINLGGGWPGLSDMALLGHPGKISYCLAEDETGSPFPPLHTSLGFQADESVVTVTCVGAPHSAIYVSDGDDSDSAERLLGVLARTIASVGNNNAVFGRGTVVVVLNPDHADLLHSAGYDRAAIQNALWKRATNPASVITDVQKTTAATFASEAGDVFPAVGAPESVLVLVAGGRGVYSVVMPPWSNGPHMNGFVTVPVVTTDECDVPIVPPVD